MTTMLPLPPVTAMKSRRHRATLAALCLLAIAGCASQHTYHNKDMDFGSIKTVAVMPFWNLTKDNLAGDRVRDVFSNMLLATNAVYVLPTGEVARAVNRAGLSMAATPSTDEVVKLGSLLKADAIITGVVKEYGEVRSQSSVANVVSVSLQMHETATGKVVWSATSTKGGIGWGARLLGATGGDPVNDVTEEAVDELFAKLFK